ncbi:MAG TPA: SUMF1/EgtB/PvdO family nonheme iron enzyme [Bryobacteraceae bacterium]|nr:SUMF1/EgtB/PvdO family nonheme iron enzyme [Bryobacteraceae bacterium]
MRPDSLYERPIPERHRAVFYLGHLEAFDWNLICRGSLDIPSFQVEFDRLFAFGIDPDSSGLPQDKPADWPGLEEISAYNTRVRSTLDGVLEESPQELLHVAIEHRLMHAETFAYMLHNLPYDRKMGPRTAPRRNGRPVDPSMVEIPGGQAILGLQKGEAFGWDNEYQRHSIDVAPFAIGKYKVTNGDYLAFVEAGATAPPFWVSRSHRWFYRGMFEEIPLPLDWPVYVSYDQAAAYAAWAGKRLITEVEYQRAAFGSGDESGLSLDPARDNYDFHEWDPVSVSSSRENKFGVVQLVGNGWEWTSTVFYPFPGFEPFPFYPGYSANFFDGQHYVMKGASQRTAAKLVRPSFRNWFRNSYPYVYATFRVAEN